MPGKIPPGAIKLADFAFKKSTGVPSSGHVVRKVNFLPGSGLKGEGFYKACDPTYPPLLAKYVVGISQLYRSSLGQRASEERLVYNMREDIVGTVSIAIDGFVPMLNNNDSLYTGDKAHLNLIANPSALTLNEYDIAALLIASYRHKEDDLHPGNLSVAGRLDYDMSWYHILSILKGVRAVSGTFQDDPINGTKLQEKDLREFPNLSSTRTHWPAQRPGNFNFLKEYKAREKFESLSTNDAFKRKMCKALLTELLSFQVDTIKARLNYQLGNTPIDLNSVSEGSERSISNKKKQILDLFADDLFYERGGGTKERKFDDHFFRFAEAEYKSFYTLVTRFDRFGQFLRENPGVFNEVKQEFVERDLVYYGELKRQYVERGEEYPEELKAQEYNIEAMDTVYDTIWRDTFYMPLMSLANGADELFSSIETKLHLDALIIEDLNRRRRGDRAKARKVESLERTAKAIPAGVERPAWTLEIAREKIFAAIKPQFEKLSVIINGYLKLEASSVEDNESVIRRCSALLDSVASKVEAFQREAKEATGLRKPHEGLIKITNSHIALWRENLDALSLTKHKAAQESLKETKVSYTYQARHVRPATEEEVSGTILSVDVDEDLTKGLISWLNEQTKEKIYTLAFKALTKYEPSTEGLLSWLNPYAYTRTRGEDIRALITKAKKEPLSVPTATNLVLDIVTMKGSTWEKGSFNVILMDILLNAMLDFTKEDGDFSSEFPSLLNFIRVKARSGDEFDMFKHIERVRSEFISTICSTPPKPRTARMAEAKIKHEAAHSEIVKKPELAADARVAL